MRLAARRLVALGVILWVPGTAPDALASGGTIVLRMDNSADGYYTALGGSGNDRFINLYPAGTSPSRSIICGARRNLFALAVILPGATAAVTAIGVDSSPKATILLGDSTLTPSGLLPAAPIAGNAMIRLLLDGDRAKLEGATAPATMGERASLRVGESFISIDRRGRRIE
jgi:hypothetical protein